MKESRELPGWCVMLKELLEEKKKENPAGQAGQAGDTGGKKT